MINANYLPERLRTERVRLKMKQEEVAKKIGISREMWGKYERGLSQPGVDVFSKFVDAGADVNYLVTGVYMLTSTTSSDETILLQNYRNATLEGKDFIRRACMMMGANNDLPINEIKQTMQGDGIQIGGSVSGTVAITNTTPKRKPRNAS